MFGVNRTYFWDTFYVDWLNGKGLNQLRRKNELDLERAEKFGFGEESRGVYITVFYMKKDIFIMSKSKNMGQR